MPSPPFFDKIIINSLLQKLEQEKDLGKYWNISWDLGVFLSNLVEEKKPCNILEIGTSNGFSTLWIAKNIEKNSKITTIEVNDEIFELARKNFELARIQNSVEQIKGEVLELLNSKKFEKEFDFIFLDAAHKFYKEVIQTLEEKKILTKNCTIVCDNVISHPYMGEFIDWMKKRYEVIIHEKDSGFLIASKIKT